jgi:hypothetical protein
MKLYAIVLGLLLCTLPAKAESFAFAGNMNVNQLATLSNGITCPCGPTVESFQTAFDFDTVSQSVTDMTFNSNGPLGPFTFSGVTANGVASNPATDFTWSSSLASIVLNEYDQYFPEHFVPSHSLTLACLSIDCVNDFNGTPPGGETQSAVSLFDLGPSGPSDPPDPPTQTPEPSSLLLLGSGIIGLASVRKLIGAKQ